MDYINIFDEKIFIMINKGVVWESGFIGNCTLEEKSKFYADCAKFKIIFQHILKHLNETVVFYGKLFKDFSLLEGWGDIENYDCFSEFRKYFKQFKAYQMNVEDDAGYFDIIIENGFRYLTNSVFYLPKIKAMVKFDCHHQIVFYPKNYDDATDRIKHILTMYDTENFEIYD